MDVSGYVLATPLKAQMTTRLKHPLLRKSYALLSRDKGDSTEVREQRKMPTRISDLLHAADWK